MTDTPVRIVLADDHRVVRDGVRDRLLQEPDFDVVGEAANGAEALSVVARERPDVLVLDIEMPGLSGIEVARALDGTEGAPRILVLSAYDDADHVAELLDAGAAGYLTKDESLRTIVDAVRGVAGGEDGWLSRSVAARVLALRRGDEAPTDARPGGLTAREAEVLRLVAEGKTNAQAAADLFLSEHTIRNHLANVYGKLNVGNRAEATTWAWKNGLLGGRE